MLPIRRPGSAALITAPRSDGRCRDAGRPPEASLLARRRGTQSCGLALRRSCTGLLPARRLRAYRLRPGAAARGPRPCSVVTPDHRGRHSGGCRRAGPGKTFLPGRIRQGPSMYEMEGPCPASPRQAGQLAGLAGAARRPPGPGTRARGRSPGSSHVPGVAPGWCPFPTVKALLLPPRAPRKALRPAISCFSAIHEGIHRKQAVIRISQRLSTGLFTACPQATGCKPENT